MSELEKIEKKDKWGDFQRNYNTTSKNIVHLLGANITLFICLLLPIFLIGFIWTDFGMLVISFHYIADGLVTCSLFIIGEMLMTRVGADGGRLDNDYINAKKEHNAILERVNVVGTMLLPIYCEWQIDLELAQAITSRLRAFRLTRADWDTIKDMSLVELQAKYGKKKGKHIFKIIRLNPIELNDAVLLYDGAEAMSRGGVPMSAEEYLHKRSHRIEMILGAIFMGLVTVAVAMTLTSDISFARVMYTVFKLIGLLFRMACGYNRGAKAYNTIEVRQIQAKCHYLRQYERFVTDKTYLRIGDKYGDVSCFVTEDDIMDTTTND